MNLFCRFADLLTCQFADSLSRRRGAWRKGNLDVSVVANLPQTQSQTMVGAINIENAPHNAVPFVYHVTGMQKIPFG